jgi:phosphate starvation-inducible protein PhoH
MQDTLEKEKLTKKERRLLRKKGVIINTGIDSLKMITPLTFNQRKAFEAFRRDKNLMFHGTPGTGKTFVALYLGLHEVINLGNHKKVVIVRSAVPSRQMGFLPGGPKDKTAVYENPYHDHCSELFHRSDAYDLLRQKKQIEFISTSFLRGLTLRDAVVIIDECQNMIWSEIYTVLTRIGENCRVIICGDTKQSDLTEREGKEDVKKLLTLCENLGSFEFIRMTSDDIVRSGFCKDVIKECEQLGY